LTNTLKYVPRLHSLKLCGTRISSVGCFDLAACLHYVPRLERLWLQNNRIEDQGCVLLAERLYRVPDLRELSLSSNCISTSGCRRLITALTAHCTDMRQHLHTNGNNIDSMGPFSLARIEYVRPELKIVY